MKKIFIAATIILVTGFSYKYNSKAQAEVNKIEQGFVSVCAFEKLMLNNLKMLI